MICITFSKPQSVTSGKEAASTSSIPDETAFVFLDFFFFFFFGLFTVFFAFAVFHFLPQTSQESVCFF